MPQKHRAILWWRHCYDACMIDLLSNAVLIGCSHNIYLFIFLSPLWQRHFKVSEGTGRIWKYQNVCFFLILKTQYVTFHHKRVCFFFLQQTILHFDDTVTECVIMKVCGLYYILQDSEIVFMDDLKQWFLTFFCLRPPFPLENILRPPSTFNNIIACIRLQ